MPPSPRGGGGPSSRGGRSAKSHGGNQRSNTEGKGNRDNSSGRNRANTTNTTQDRSGRSVGSQINQNGRNGPPQSVSGVRSPMGGQGSSGSAASRALANMAMTRARAPTSAPNVSNFSKGITAPRRSSPEIVYKNPQGAVPSFRNRPAADFPSFRASQCPAGLGPRVGNPNIGQLQRPTGFTDTTTIQRAAEAMRAGRSPLSGLGAPAAPKAFVDRVPQAPNRGPTMPQFAGINPAGAPPMATPHFTGGPPTRSRLPGLPVQTAGLNRPHIPGLFNDGLGDYPPSIHRPQAPQPTAIPDSPWDTAGVPSRRAGMPPGMPQGGPEPLAPQLPRLGPALPPPGMGTGGPQFAGGGSNPMGGPAMASATPASAPGPAGPQAPKPFDWTLYLYGIPGGMTGLSG